MSTDQPITYQQLLAQEFSNRATDILVYQQETVDDNEEDVGAREYRGAGYELEESDKFNSFAGNRNIEENISKAKEYEDKSKLSVRYNKDIQTRVFNIDSRFRAYASAGGLLQYGSLRISSNVRSLASHFIFRASRLIKNAISIKLSSLEIPNIFANFSSTRGNTSFQVKTAGDFDSNYSIAEINKPVNDIQKPLYIQTPAQLASRIETALKTCGVLNAESFTCTLDSGHIQIKNSSTTAYTFNFEYTGQDNPLFDSLGVEMGFDVKDSSTYTNVVLNTNGITGIFSPTMETDDYFYLKINDYDTVTPQSINDSFFTVFAKIPITVSKGNLIVDNDSTNSTTKTYRFLQPTNIQYLEIQLLDRAGQELTFDGNFSMTLEVDEVVSHSLYEKLREL